MTSLALINNAGRGHGYIGVGESRHGRLASAGPAAYQSQRTLLRPLPSVGFGREPSIHSLQLTQPGC